MGCRWEGSNCTCVFDDATVLKWSKVRVLGRGIFLFVFSKLFFKKPWPPPKITVFLPGWQSEIRSLAFCTVCFLALSHALWILGGEGQAREVCLCLSWNTANGPSSHLRSTEMDFLTLNSNWKGTDWSWAQKQPLRDRYGLSYPRRQAKRHRLAGRGFESFMPLEQTPYLSRSRNKKLRIH